MSVSMHIRQSCDSWVITFASSLFRWSHILSVSYSPLVLFSQDAITFPFLYLLYKLCKGVCNGPCSLQIPETEYICVCICEKGPYPTLVMALAASKSQKQNTSASASAKRDHIPHYESMSFKDVYFCNH